MTTFSVDRCQSCRTTIDLDWSAVSCPCGAVVTCDGCDEVEACDTCRAARDEGRAVVHNHPPYNPACNERRVDGQLRGACLNDDGSDR